MVESEHFCDKTLRPMRRGRSPKLSIEQHQKVAKMVADGHAITEIASTFRVSRNTIHRVFARIGVISGKVRDRGLTRTHCKEGHSLTGDNIIITRSLADGVRYRCRTCHRLDDRKQKRAGRNRTTASAGALSFWAE